MDLKDHIRSIPDFPKKGILFYDISTLLAHADAWQVALGRLAKLVGRHRADILAGIESRGFLVAAPLASRLQADAIGRGQRVVILDDLLATGGTMAASIELFSKVGAEVVGAACIIELTFLNGRSKLDSVPFDALIAYDE